MKNSVDRGWVAMVLVWFAPSDEESHDPASQGPNRDAFNSAWRGTGLAKRSLPACRPIWTARHLNLAAVGSGGS